MSGSGPDAAGLPATASAVVLRERWGERAWVVGVRLQRGDPLIPLDAPGRRSV